LAGASTCRSHRYSQSPSGAALCFHAHGIAGCNHNRHKHRATTPRGDKRDDEEEKKESRNSWTSWAITTEMDVPHPPPALELPRLYRTWGSGCWWWLPDSKRAKTAARHFDAGQPLVRLSAISTGFVLGFIFCSLIACDWIHGNLLYTRSGSYERIKGNYPPKFLLLRKEGRRAEGPQSLLHLRASNCTSSLHARK
jgi:hypothetical protein